MGTSIDRARSIGSCTTKEQLATDAEDYAMRVIESYDLSVDIGDINFEASGRLTKAHGNARSLDGDTYLIKVSWPAYKQHGWHSIRDTIRHELAHVVQYERDGYTNHDWRFERIAEELNAPVSADTSAAQPRYIIECTNCGETDTRQRKSKVVKHADRYHCQSCGGDIISYEYTDSDD